MPRLVLHSERISSEARREPPCGGEDRLLADRVQAELGLDARNASIKVFDGLDDTIVDPDDIAGIADLVEFEQSLVEKRDARIFQLREERINLGLGGLGLVVDKRHCAYWVVVNERDRCCVRR
jgi:hypothetical protein